MEQVGLHLRDGGGLMGTLIRAKDWSQTALGPTETWPSSLGTALSICLASRFPMFIWWGPELRVLYNEACIPILGSKHPRMLGLAGRDAWGEVWDVVGPMLDRVLASGEASWSEDTLLALRRSGIAEEAYFTWSFSPIFDEAGGVGGAFTAITETTPRVIGERRRETLRTLGEQLGDVRDIDTACARALGTIQDDAHDFAFAALYLLEGSGGDAGDGKRATLRARTDNLASNPAFPDALSTDPARDPARGPGVWPIAEVLRSGELALVGDLPARIGAPPRGAWPEAPHSAAVVPVARAGGRPYGVLIAGVSPRLVFDEAYQAFYALTAGHIAAALSVAVEITDQVLARRAVEQSHAEAVAANRAKDEFLAMLGHELRNPLAPILTALELMRLRGGDLLTRERAIIERQTHHLAAMLEDLLDVSRIARGMIQLRRERMSLADVIAKAIETAAPLVEQQRHEVVTDVPRYLAIDADIARMTQVFANLLTNAAKYTDPGGRVTVVARSEGNEVLVTVTDTGRGIAPDMIPRVFELFVQEPQNLDCSRGGLGLGLAIVRSLVELHGGRVEVSSPGVGRGSTFMVHLPRARDVAVEIPAMESSVAPIAARPERRARSVLVVDDNVDAANLLADLLASHGYMTRVAHDGPQVLEFAQDFVPDIALLDIGLPAMDGYELALRLRTLPSWRNVRMLAVTGYGQSSDRTRSAEAGFDHHLVKPISIAMLEDLLPGVCA